MTEIERLSMPPGPPWSDEVLADLHAGVFAESVANQLWPLVRNDSEARAVLAALDATQQDLAHLPVIPMPKQVVDRIDAALAELTNPAAQPMPFAEHSASRTTRRARRSVPSRPSSMADTGQARRQRQRRMMGWGVGVLTAAAAI